MKKFNKYDALNDKNRSIIGALLSEISWEGSKVTRYRNGGKGLENVLTTEVFQILSFLPRTFFLGEIIKNFKSKNHQIINTLFQQIEESEFQLFPGNYYLIEDPESHQKGIPLQPDALLNSQSVYALIEAKRIKRGSFQKEQLAKEYYLVTREAKDKQPMLMLIIPSEPKVSVQGKGKIDPIEEIKDTLAQVYQSSDSHHLTLEALTLNVDNHVAWITWQDIYSIIKIQRDSYHGKNPSDTKSIYRLCSALLDAIERHSS